MSKMLQSKDMQFDVALNCIQNTIDFLKSYKETGFDSAEDAAKQLATELEMDESEINFATTQSAGRRRRVRRQFDYEAPDEPISDPKDKFRIEFFNVLLDQAKMSMNERFDQMKAHYDKFGFLHNFGRIKGMSETDLRKCCDILSDILTDEISGSDVDAHDLCAELRTLADLVPESTDALKSLQFIYENNLKDSFPNVSVALRIALTVPVTVASAERSFSKLKLIMSDQRTSMTQERLNGLALISIEHKVVDSLDYADLIKDSAKMKVRKVFLH